MNRVLAAARLHLIHPAVSLSIPWIVVGLSFAINLVVWHLTPAGEDDGGFTGGVMALYVTVLVVYAIGLRLFRSVLPAGLAAGLVALDGLAVTSSRIAMLDAVLALFTTTAVWSVLLDRDARRRGGLVAPRARRGQPERSTRWRRPSSNSRRVYG